MRNVAEATVMLSQGYWRQGACHREARVRGIAECNAPWSDALSALALPIDRATLLLSHCVTQIGEVTDVQTSTLRELSMGDREALLLHVRRLTFGERIECVLRCAVCDEPMDLELGVSDLLVAPADDPRQLYTEFFCAGDERFRVCFRIPTGADVKAAIGDGNLEGVVPDLLARCIDSVERADSSEENRAVSLHRCPPALVDQISARLAELDGQAEIALQAVCPACRREFRSIFDVTDFLLRELEGWERRLYRDVHLLALAYHWSENEILEMSPRKRKMYLDMLEGENLS